MKRAGFPDPLDRLTDRELTVFALFNAAARRGSRCPSNSEIADLVELNQTNYVSEMANKFQRLGLITVARQASGRAVTIVASGASTAFNSPGRGGAEAVIRAADLEEAQQLVAARRLARGEGLPEPAEPPCQAIETTAKAVNDAFVRRIQREAMRSAERSGARRAVARKLSAIVHDPLPLARAPERCSPATAARVAGKPMALGRDPCPRCGARGDLGCDHFAPFTPEMQDTAA